MNCNEIRFYLHNYDNLRKEIGHLKESLEEYRKMNISGIKAQVITDMPLTHSNTSKTETMALTRIDYIKDLENEIDGKMRLCRVIESVIFYLNDVELRIIELRYFVTPIGKPKLNWLQISNELNYSEVRCKKIDGKIIRNIQERYIRSIRNVYVSGQTA